MLQEVGDVGRGGRVRVVGGEEGCTKSGSSVLEPESESGSSSKGEGREWKGRIWVQRREAIFPALPRRPH